MPRSCFAVSCPHPDRNSSDVAPDRVTTSAWSASERTGVPMVGRPLARYSCSFRGIDATRVAVDDVWHDTHVEVLRKGGEARGRRGSEQIDVGPPRQLGHRLLLGMRHISTSMVSQTVRLCPDSGFPIENA